jgi:hypothetical protein
LGIDANEEQELLASNFFKVGVSGWGNSTAEEMCSIVRRSSLRFFSEDSPVAVISTFGASGSPVELLGEVECEFLSQPGIDGYLNLISLSDIDETHWTSICCPLHRDVPPNLSGSQIVSRAIEHRGGADFDGILRHLKEQHGGNIRDAVSIEASPHDYGDRYNLTNYEAQTD